LHRKAKKFLSTSLPEEKKAHPISNDSENIKISSRINKGPSYLEEPPVINGKKPSADLICQIKEFGSSCVNPKNLKQKIREKGIEEGFSDLEINLLAREVLRDRLSSRQLNYWFPLKRDWKKKEESSSRNLQFVKNDSEKLIEKSQVAVTSEPVEGNVTVPLQSPEESQLEESVSSESSDLNATAPTAVATGRKNPNRIFTFFNLPDPDTQTVSKRDSEQIVNSNDDSTIKPTAKIGNARSISYLDLVNPETIDCTNHPMYRSANEKIEQLKLALFEKTEETRRLKEEISYKH
jgi:hypothetical protein